MVKPTMLTQCSRVGSRRGSGFDDADVSSILPIIPYGQAFQAVPSQIVDDLSLLPACAVRRLVCIRPSCTLVVTTVCPALCRAAASVVHRRGGILLLRPRGPRSGSGCSVPILHHLFDPIRPTRGRTAISPRSGLYAMPSLCGSA